MLATALGFQGHGGAQRHLIQVSGEESALFISGEQPKSPPGAASQSRVTGDHSKTAGKGAGHCPRVGSALTDRRSGKGIQPHTAQPGQL